MGKEKLKLKDVKLVTGQGKNYPYYALVMVCEDIQGQPREVYGFLDYKMRFVLGLNKEDFEFRAKRDRNA